MREITFRGKRTLDGKWVEGDLGHYPDRTKIDTHTNGQPWRGFDVFPETVGQYTGQTDKNGRRIFEGDILHAYFDKENPQDLTVATVVWNGYRWATVEHHPTRPDTEPYELFTGAGENWAVVGNIHDDPVLPRGWRT